MYLQKNYFLTKANLIFAILNFQQPSYFVSYCVLFIIQKLVMHFNDIYFFFQVKYSIVQQPNQKGTKFTVDEETGEVSTNKVFDREGDDGKFVSVTIKATDQGEPSLEGVCSFTVEITDVNDNPPLFDRQVPKYKSNYSFTYHIY